MITKLDTTKMLRTYEILDDMRLTNGVTPSSTATINGIARTTELLTHVFISKVSYAIISPISTDLFYQCINIL